MLWAILWIFSHIIRGNGTEPILLWYGWPSKHHDPWDGPHPRTVPCFQRGERTGLLWWSLSGNMHIYFFFFLKQITYKYRELFPLVIMLTKYSGMRSWRRPPPPWRQEISVLTLHRHPNPKSVMILELSAIPVVSLHTRARLTAITWVTQVQWICFLFSLTRELLPSNFEKTITHKTS